MQTVFLLTVLGICSIEDIRRRTISIWLMGVGGVAGILLLIFGHTITWGNCIGGIFVGLLVLGLSILSKERIGKGDGIMMIVSGIYLGFWNNVMLLWCATGMAGIFGIYCMIFREKPREYQLPFVPFLFAAFIVMIAVQGGKIL